MTRPLTLLFTAVSLAGASCQPQAGAPPESDEPVVGRLQLQDHILDLTVDSFADGPQAVPKNAQAQIMADIIEIERKDATTSANGL